MWVKQLTIFTVASCNQMCNFGTLVSTAPLFRRAFPCFDEPSFKSTFRITIVRPTDGYIALSNMPEEESFPDKPDVGLTEVRFQVEAT